MTQDVQSARSDIDSKGGNPKAPRERRFANRPILTGIITGIISGVIIGAVVGGVVYAVIKS